MIHVITTVCGITGDVLKRVERDKPFPFVAMTSEGVNRGFMVRVALEDDRLPDGSVMHWIDWGPDGKSERVRLKFFEIRKTK